MLVYKKIHIHVFHSSNNTALKKSYSFLKEGLSGPERKFVSHHDPATPLKRVCRVWEEPQRGLAGPQK